MPLDFDLIRRFDELPNDAVVPLKVTAVILNMSERTVRRQSPVRRVQTSPRCFGNRVGDIRALVRGESAAT
jgi:hypothetical protein